MKKYLFFLVVVCGCLAINAQPNPPISVYGMIKDVDGVPVAGVTVKVKGDVNGTMTDSVGMFRIKVPALPITLNITHQSFEAQEITAQSSTPLALQLVPRVTEMDEVFLKSKGLPTRIKDASVTVDIIGSRKIPYLPTTSVYDAIGYSKGFDNTRSSLTFNTPSTRGFNGSGSSRVNQLVDGMDNQAPGLNFFVGNFTGPTELDIESVELLPGASSALYGPGGMNGTILINSKSPFQYKGLSVQARQGLMHVDKSQRGKAKPYYDYSFRWAGTFNNKLAFKIGAQYLSATDWLANDSSNYLRQGTEGKLIPGTRASDPNYDGVNVYGDETSVDIRPFIMGAIQQNAAIAPILNPFLSDPQYVSRTGYHEKDIIDPETRNIKATGALHYKLTDKLEAILMGNWSTGNTVYTDDNRYALKGIKISQYKAELKHKNWFWRTYTTQENAGEAYSATVATQYFNEGWKRSYDPNNVAGSWYPQYVGAFATGAVPVFQQAFMNALGSGQSQQEAMATAQAAVLSIAPQLHQAARAYADRDRPAPGSALFEQIFTNVRKTPIPRGGLFKEKSQLWMTEGQYNFSNWKFAELIVGGNYKKYVLDSDGTIFIDTAGAIKMNEFGAYAQLSKKLLDDKLVLTASGRYDKNENFKGKFTPRVAALIRLATDHNLRLSYQTAYRFPSNLTQWIRLDVGSDYLLLGGLPWVMDYMNAYKNPVYEIVNGVPGTTPYEYKELKPESMQSFEIGYKSFINKKLLIDAYAYFGRYKDFVGRIGLYQPATGEAYSIVVNSANKVKTHGFGLGFDYRIGNNYSLFLNGYSDRITDVPTGFRSYFNTPKYRVNAGFGNTGMGKKERVSFNVMMRWQDAFDWEGELANGPLKAFSTVDAQVSYRFSKHIQARLGGTNITNSYYQTGYGMPKIGGLYYTSILLTL